MRLVGSDALRRFRHRLRDIQHELPVGGKVVGRLRRQGRDSGAQGFEGSLLDLLCRRGQPERALVRVGQLAHELVVTLLVCVAQVLCERVRFLEGLEEAGLAERDEQPGAGQAPLHRIPFRLGEVGLGRHLHSPLVSRLSRDSRSS